MIILSALAFVILVVVLLLNKIGWEVDTLRQFIAMVILIIASIMLAIFIIWIPIARNDHTLELLEFNVIKNTIETSRLKSDRYENTSLQLKVIEANSWLARAKYDNSGLGDIWISDEVEKLTKIK